jgi:hypothetical protein
MHRWFSSVGLAVAFAAFSGCSLEAGHAMMDLVQGSQESVERFEWSGEIAEGDAIEIKGINGQVVATRTSGDDVEVTATRTGRRDDPNEVRIEVVEHNGGVTICAVYPREGNECLPGDRGRLSVRNNDVKVEFEVRVPDGVAFAGRSVNGSIRAEDLDSDVIATTVNGAIDISTSGRAEAETVNGSIEADMGRADWDHDVSFETVNGSISITLPEDVNANVRARTVNGRIRTDLPLTVREVGRRRLDGRLGDGGPELELETVNGSISLNSRP